MNSWTVQAPMSVTNESTGGEVDDNGAGNHHPNVSKCRPAAPDVDVGPGSGTGEFVPLLLSRPQFRLHPPE
jgi:hypothetical protein